MLQNRPVDSKATEFALRNEKTREGAEYKQAEATAALVEATIPKYVILVEQNLIMLMTTPSTDSMSPAAKRFLAI